MPPGVNRMRSAAAQPAVWLGGRSRTRAGWRARLLVAALAGALMGAGALAGSRLALGVTQHRQRAALIDGEIVAEAMETYDLSQGRLPVAATPAALQAALAPYLVRPVIARGGTAVFAYKATAQGYRLRFRPVGGPGVLLQVSLGVGGTAQVAGMALALGW